MNEVDKEKTRESLWETEFPEIEITDRKRSTSDRDRTMLILGAGYTERYDQKWSRSAIWEDALSIAKDDTNLNTIYKYMLEYKNSEEANYEKFLAHCRKENKGTVDFTKVKEIFVRTMLSACLAQPDETQKEKIGKTLLRFDQVFTTNYDPLIYRSFIYTMKNNNEQYRYCFGDFFDNENNYNPTLDEFKFGLERRDQTQISYLHGAFFLVRKNKIVEKIKQTEDVNAMMQNAKERYLKNNCEPLIITDASSQNKLEMIQKNPYLENSLERLRNYKNSKICIIGFKGNEEDKHIVDAIIESEPKKVIICTHNEKANENILKLIKTLEHGNCENVESYCVLNKEDKMIPSD